MILLRHLGEDAHSIAFVIELLPFLYLLAGSRAVLVGRMMVAHLAAVVVRTLLLTLLPRASPSDSCASDAQDGCIGRGGSGSRWTTYTNLATLLELNSQRTSLEVAI